MIGVLNGIDVIAEALSVVDAARRSGRRVFLASNQQAHRADHMSNVLGYGRLFDREFYSCRIGVAKPNPAYFQKILAETGLRAGAALFIDDRPENVRGALSVGMRGFVHDETMGAAALRTALAGFGVTLAPDLSETD